MGHLGAAALVLLVALPVIGGVGAARLPRLAAQASGVALALAVALAVPVFADSPVSAVLFSTGDGRAVLGLTADRLTVVLLALVLGVSAVVQVFGSRYLAGDARQNWFRASTGLLTSATAGMVASASLIGLAVGWTLAGVALCLLLATYPQLPAARAGARRAALTFGLGDLALWAGVVVATVQFGTVDLRDLSAQRYGSGAVVAVVACLLVVAAAARSAQVPMQGWLPATLAAPTPVSALLHAGVVNAGGVLLVRTSPLFGSSALATHLAFALGAVTAVYGTLSMLVKPDIKGALAASTMGQMGFMIMTCGLGLTAAAIFHLVAHGMYKATLFLGSGSAVRRHVREALAPPVAVRSAVAAAVPSLVLPIGALVLATVVFHPALDGRSGSVALLVFAAATGVRATWGWLRRCTGLRPVLTALVAVLLAAPAYVLLVREATAVLTPALRDFSDTAVSPWAAVPVALVLALAGLVVRFDALRPLSELRRNLYVLTLRAGTPSASRRRRAPSTSPAPRAAASSLLLPTTSGGRL